MANLLTHKTKIDTIKVSSFKFTAWQKGSVVNNGSFGFLDVTWVTCVTLVACKCGICAVGVYVTCDLKHSDLGGPSKTALDYYMRINDSRYGRYPRKKKDIYRTKSGAMSDSTENKNRNVCRLNQANFFLCHRFLLLVFSSSWLYRFSPDVPTFQLWIFKTRGQKSHESEIEPRIRETPVRREKADPLDCWLDRMRPSLTNFACLWNSRTIFSQSFVTSVRLLLGKKKKSKRRNLKKKEQPRTKDILKSSYSSNGC